MRPIWDSQKKPAKQEQAAQDAYEPPRCMYCGDRYSAKVDGKFGGRYCADSVPCNDRRDEMHAAHERGLAEGARDADDTGCWERKPGSGQCGLHLMPLIHRGRCIEGIRAASRAEGARAERERPWFLLYGGASEDGMGPGRYVGRTTDPDCARKHFAEVKSDPYSTGYVMIVTDTACNRVWRIDAIRAAQDEHGGKGE